MTYVVLARKLRPARFADLIGQETTARILRNALLNDRVAHAFLFCGSRGTGKTSAARILTRALNCLDPEDGDPCGRCDNCREIASNASSDVFEIDAASNRGIENIRELRENVNYTPARCRYKVYIIDEAHMLTLESFNALLKTLEEPPPHVKFILATTDPHKVPQTIVSRCQRYDFLRIPVQKMADYLEGVVHNEGIDLPRKSLELIARHSVGGMRDALTAIDQVLSSVGTSASEEEVAQALGLMDSQGRLSLLSALMGKNTAEAMRVFQDIQARGHDLHDLLAELLDAVKTISLLQTLGPDPGLFEHLPTEERDALAELGTQASADELQQMFQILLELEERMKRSAYARICFEMAILQLASVHPLIGIPELIRQVQALPAQPGGPSASGSPATGSPRPPTPSGPPPGQPPSAAPVASSASVSPARSITSVLKGESSARVAEAPSTAASVPASVPAVPEVPPAAAAPVSAPVAAPEPGVAESVAESAPSSPEVHAAAAPASVPVASAPTGLEPEAPTEPPPDLWIRFVEEVGRHSSRLGGMLRNALPDALEGGVLHLAFRQPGLEQMLTAQHLTTLTEVASTFLSRPVSLVQQAQPSSWRTLSEQQQFLEREEQDRKRRDAENLPLVQTLLKVFPGSHFTVRLT